MTDAWSALTGKFRSKDSVDYTLLWGLIALGVTGVAMIYSATREPLLNAGYNPHYYLERQGLFVVIGVVAMYVISLIDYRRLEILATPLYVCALLGLAGVFLLGQSALGAQRWYNLGFVQVQPSEFTVLILILAVATYCQRRPEGLAMYDVVRILVMGGVPLLMIVLQPDLGTSIIIILTVAAMMVVAGVPPRFMSFLAVAGSAAVAAAVYLKLLHKYQIDRFISFFHRTPPIRTCSGSSTRSITPRARSDRAGCAARGSFTVSRPCSATSPSSAPTSSSPRSASNSASSARV